MVSFQFARLLSQAAAGKIVGSAIYQLVGLQVVHLFVLLAPFAFFMATLLALSRLSSTNELIAMRAVGFSHQNLYSTLFSLAIPLAIFMLLMNLFILPEVLSLNYRLLDKARKQSQLSIIQPGQFRSIGENTTLFVADVDNQQFSKFFVWQKTKEGETITVAKSGQQTESADERRILLNTGSRYQMNNDGSAQWLIFKELDILLPAIQATSEKSKLKSISTTTLLTEPTRTHQVELQRRISAALTILLLTFYAPLLIPINPRENRYGKFVTAILVYALYSNSQSIFQALTESGRLPLTPGVYSAHLFFILLLLFLFSKNRRHT